MNARLQRAERACPLGPCPQAPEGRSLARVRSGARGTELPVVLTLLAVVGSGCVDDDKMFYIRQNQAPSNGCVVSTSADSKVWAAGVLDVSVKGYGYYMNPLVENHMASTQGTDNQPERNLVHMRSFSIELDVDGSTISLPTVGGRVGEFPVSGVIDPGGSEVFAGVPVIPGNITNVINLQPGQTTFVDVHLRAVAERSGGTVESSEFVYPVLLCHGCLVVGDPNALCSTLTTTVGNACGLPQDERVTCCVDDVTNSPECTLGTGTSSGG